MSPRTSEPRPVSNAQAAARIIVDFLGRVPTGEELALVTIVLAHFVDPDDLYQPL